MHERHPSAPHALVGLQGVAAVGIVVWWVYWFASGSNTHGTRCALLYENSFPVADLVLAAAIATTAFALVRTRHLGRASGPLMAGMAFSLATLDTTHNLLTGGFSGPIDVTLRKALFAVVNGAVGVWTLSWLHRHGEQLGHRVEMPRWLGTASMAASMTVLPAGCVYAMAGDGCDGALSGSLIGVGVLLMGLAVASLLQRRPSWVLLGTFVHMELVVLGHGFL